MQHNLGVLNRQNTLQSYPSGLHHGVHGFIKVKGCQVLLQGVHTVAVGDQEFLFVILKILLNIMKLSPLNRVELVVEDRGDIIVDDGPSVRGLRVNHVIVIVNKGINLFLGLGIRRVARLFIAL